MVKVIFKLSEHGEVKINQPHPTSLEDLLAKCSGVLGEPIGSVIAISNGKVIGLTDLVNDNDAIDIYPALSGG
ncbi:MAG: hypothetical protein OCC45_09115 [Desulfotalea sp.]